MILMITVLYFFQSHIEKNENNTCKYQISSNYYDWQTLSERYSYSNTAGGLSIYAFKNPARNGPAPLPEGSVRINAENFPDDVFRKILSRDLDKDHDGILSAEEIANVKSLGISSREKVSDLTGIKHFTALTSLGCIYNSIQSLDVSSMDKLWSINCYSNKMKFLDVRNCPSLANLNCSSNQLTTLDLSGCPVLEELDCENNQLTALDLSGRPKLTYVRCYHNQLVFLDVSGCFIIWPGHAYSDRDYDTKLLCQYNQLKYLNVSGCTYMQYLYCFDNKLTSLNVNDCASLRDLHCESNDLTDLNVSGVGALQGISCYSNQLKSLKLSVLSSLKWLKCQNNKLSEIQIVACPVLENNNITCDDGVKITHLTVPAITTGGTLTKATLNKSYSLTLKATGSTPITWKLVSSTTLPDGLKLNKSTGKISGTPKTEGTFKFKIRATNNAGYVNKTFTLTVGKKPSITTLELPYGLTGTSYSQTLKA